MAKIKWGYDRKNSDNEGGRGNRKRPEIITVWWEILLRGKEKKEVFRCMGTLILFDQFYRPGFPFHQLGRSLWRPRDK
jgi:hypothetical protein